MERHEKIMIATGVMATALVVYFIYRLEKQSQASAVAAQSAATELQNSSVSGISASALSGIASSPAMTLDTTLPASTAPTSSASSIDGDLSPNVASVLKQIVSTVTGTVNQTPQAQSVLPVISNFNLGQSGLTSIVSTLVPDVGNSSPISNPNGATVISGSPVSGGTINNGQAVLGVGDSANIFDGLTPAKGAFVQ